MADPSIYKTHERSITSPRPTTTTTTTIQAPPPYTFYPPSIMSAAMQNLQPAMGQYEEDDDESLSPIVIKIKIPLTIEGDENHVSGNDACFPISRVATGIAQALKQASLSGAGVPMIDEEGRPRPVRVEVDAAITITGHRNVIADSVLGVAAANLKRKATEEQDAVFAEYGDLRSTKKLTRNESNPKAQQDTLE